MVYEFELNMKALAVKALKSAHASFMVNDIDHYEEALDAAASAIDSIRRLGLSEDNPRFLWVGRLTCDWRLVSSLRQLQHPKLLEEIYLDCYYVPYPTSLVIDEKTPYLPTTCEDVFEFYNVPLKDADLFAEDLSRAITLYGEITGGGVGTDLLYRAGLALRKGQYQQAITLTEQARGIGGQWLAPYADALFQQIIERRPN